MNVDVDVNSIQICVIVLLLERLYVEKMVKPIETNVPLTAQINQSLTMEYAKPRLHNAQNSLYRLMVNVFLYVIQTKAVMMDFHVMHNVFACLIHNVPNVMSA